MINKVWSIFIVCGIIYSLISGNIETVNNEILTSCKTSLNLIMEIFPVMALWLGIMRIAEVSGLLKKLSIMLSPILGKLFPELPKGHEAISLIASNVISNMAGLGSAATPFGLKAMKSLDSINSKKNTASRSMITFLVLNTSGVTIIPTTIISLRLMYGSMSATEIVVPCIIATFFSSFFGLLFDKYLGDKYANN
ncbi:MAG: spore maturation protein [Bacilli bacterium]|nr:spore maturation protein [Bacilli bacterium]